DGRWTQVASQIAPTDQDREDSARHTNQIRAFYEASASTLWITFHADCMWWSFAAPGVSQRAEGAKVRATIEGGHQDDIRNQPLAPARLSGGLLAVQAYRGTICAVEPSYVLHAINCVDAPRVAAAAHALAALIESLHTLVERP